MITLVCSRHEDAACLPQPGPAKGSTRVGTSSRPSSTSDDRRTGRAPSA
jgi:hypothetical protein